MANNKALLIRGEYCGEYCGMFGQPTDKIVLNQPCFVGDVIVAHKDIEKGGNGVLYAIVANKKALIHLNGIFDENKAITIIPHTAVTEEFVWATSDDDAKVDVRLLSDSMVPVYPFDALSFEEKQLAITHNFLDNSDFFNIADNPKFRGLPISIITALNVLELSRGDMFFDRNGIHYYKEETVMVGDQRFGKFED